jgi:nitroimidazol reductase NimA-like FMN-containing flavoprotein (pyridoxamine 5'-phosphate oxidase superfamily)
MDKAIDMESGDLARRISHRCQELGLTVEDLARQAGVDPGFLAYFEQHSDVQLGRRTLTRIARVLQTSPGSLCGGERNRASGSASALPGAILEPLTPAQCRSHLEAGGVGRVIVCASRGPVALPVNYWFSEGEVLFNTTLNTARELESQGTVGFEIDRIDDVFSEGWSVIVTGSARLVDNPDELVEHATRGIKPWAGGARGAVVAITADEVTGRVIIHDGSVERTAGGTARPLGPSAPRQEKT